MFQHYFGCLMQDVVLIFQHTGHLSPNAFVVLTAISVSSPYSISALEVIQSSEKSTSLVVSVSFLFK